MKVALISDLHAHMVALEATLKEIDREGVDAIVCLGDIVDVGPYPAETVDLLRDRGVACIQGNHDPLDEHPTLPFLAEVEEWTLGQLDEEQLRWLRELPKELTLDLDGSTLWCVHGSPRSYDDQLLADTPEPLLRAWVGDREFDVMACGHTHVQLLRRLDERWIVNVGSTGQPFLHAHEGIGAPVILPWFEYAIVEGGPRGARASLHRVAADRQSVEGATLASGMPQPETWLSLWRW